MKTEQTEQSRPSAVALIPAYDEARFIPDVVSGTLAVVGKCIVVDDGSNDDTAALAANAGATVIAHEGNRGKGAAIKSALAWLIANEAYDYGILLDGDGQHAPAEIARFIDAAERTGSRLLVGNRMADTREMPAVRRFVNWYMSWEISRVCGRRIPDSQCGFRMVHRELAPKLLASTNSFDYETEMLFVASRLGENIAAVPVSTIYGDETSKIRPLRDTLAFYKLLARYRAKRRAA